MEEKSKLEVNMLGVRFSLQADEDISYLEGLVDCFRSHVKTASSYVRVDESDQLLKTDTSIKVAILAGVLLADKFFKQKRSLGDLSSRLSQVEQKPKKEETRFFHKKDSEEDELALIENLVSKLESVLEEI